jgi:hypothetical protein
MAARDPLRYVLTLREFADLLSVELRVPIPPDENRYLSEIAGYDELCSLQVLKFFEDTLCADVPLQLWPTMTTVGELYLHYRIRWEQASGAGMDNFGEI